MSVPKRDGTTRSNLCLYVLFRSFTGTVNLCAVRLARQVCTASRRKLAAASRPTAREAADRLGFRDGTTRSNLCLYMLFRLFTGTVIVCALRLARQVCTASRSKLAAASRLKAREVLPVTSSRKKKHPKRCFFFLELVTGLGPVTSSLPRTRSTC